MLEICLTILPVFLIIALGMILERRRYFPLGLSGMLNLYVLRLALPVVLFRIMAEASPASIAQGRFWLALLLAQFLVYGFAYWADRVLSGRGPGPAVITGMGCCCANAAFLGLPIVACLMPGNAEALLAAGIGTVVPSIVLAFGQSHLELIRQKGLHGKPATPGQLLYRAVLKNPMVLGILLGCLLCFSGIGLWAPLGQVAGMIGITSAPCALLALGLDMRSRMRVAVRAEGSHKAARQGAIACVKLVLHPLLAWLLLAALGVDPQWLVPAVLVLATATGVAVYVVAEVYATVPEESALTVILTNSLNFVTISAFAYAFRMLGML